MCISVQVCIFVLNIDWFIVFKTSNSLTWTLHLLSKYPECQDRLYKDVCSAVPGDQIPSAEAVARIPYLRAVVKESLR